LISEFRFQGEPFLSFAFILYCTIISLTTSFIFTTTILHLQATILAVGYFILGPSELYKLTKEIGKFVQNFRTLGAEATKSFESTMENQLELTELRKAQRELNDAFSFRRSINTNEVGEAFDEGLLRGEGGAVAAAGGVAAATATATVGEESEEGTKKKRRRLVRRKKKAVIEQPAEEERDLLDEYPDLEMLDEPSSRPTDNDDDAESLRAQRLERLSGQAEPDWFTASEEDIASRVLNQQQPANPALEAFEKNRFKSQLSAEEWNAQIMANEDKLSPLAMVMKRLAILEEEKQAADRRLEEEYQRRMDNEDKFYLEKRRVLEESIEEIQEGLYGGGAMREEGVNNGPKFS
jgi:Sec-independent protein translocase protein TatA